MTSSPGPMPSACSTASWATVPLLISTACRTPQYAAQASSKASVRAAHGEHAGPEDLQDGLLLGWADVGPGNGDHRFLRGVRRRRIGRRRWRRSCDTTGTSRRPRGWQRPGTRRPGEPGAAGADPADAAGRAPDDERVVGDVARDDGPGAHGGEAPDVRAGDDDGAGADRAAVPQGDRRDDPVVGPGQLARGRDRPRVPVVGEDRVGADEDAVLDRDAVVHERQVLDLDAVAERDALVDEGVAADHALGADAGAGADLGAVPDGGAWAHRHVRLEVGGRVNARGGIDHDGRCSMCGFRAPRRAAVGPEVVNADRQRRSRVYRRPLERGVDRPRV